jgi:hypothetical protein
MILNRIIPILLVVNPMDIVDVVEVVPVVPTTVPVDQSGEIITMKMNHRRHTIVVTGVVILNII